MADRAVVIVRACGITGHSHFDNNAISRHCRVVPGYARLGVSAGGEGGGGLLGPVCNFSNQRLLERGAVEDIHAPCQEKVVVSRCLSLTHDDLDRLPAGDGLAGVEGMRNELAEDDVGLCGDRGGGVPRSHSGGELGGPGGEARKLRSVSPARIRGGGDRTEGSRFEIEFSRQRELSSATHCNIAWRMKLRYNQQTSQ